MRKTLLFMLLAVAMLLGSCARQKHTFEIKDGKFLYDGEKVQLICGEMHYPRIPVEYWRDRMQRAKAMGLNTISAYVFWAVHEPQPGEFNFEGQADIARFVEIAAERVCSFFCAPVHTFVPSSILEATHIGCRTILRLFGAAIIQPS